MKITKKAINAELPSLAYYKSCYASVDMLAPKSGFLKLVIIRVRDNWDIIIRDYAVGQGQEQEDFKRTRTGSYSDITDIIREWIISPCMDRRQVVSAIQSKFIEDTTPDSNIE